MNDLMAYILGSGLPKQADGLLPVAQDAQAEPAVVDFRDFMASMLSSETPNLPAELVPISDEASDDAESAIAQQDVNGAGVLNGIPLTLHVEGVSQLIPGQPDQANTDQTEEDVRPACRITPMVFDIESGENESNRTVAISEPPIDAAKETQRISPDIVQDKHTVIPDVTIPSQQSGKILPVELHVDVVESIEDMSERDEIRKIVESAKVEIHVAERLTPDKNPIAITSDPNPLPRHTTPEPQPAITIRLETDGKTIALPVILDETRTEDRLTLRIDDQGKARLSGPVREMIDSIPRADTPDRIMKRAEITVARVIHVSQPERLLKELSPKSFARDNVIDIRPANGETPRSISPTLESGTRTDLDSGRYGYERADKRGVSLTRIDIAKQTVSQDASIEKFVREIELQVGRETSDRQSQIPIAKDALGKPMVFSQEVVKPPEMPARPLFETVKFKVQLPDSGLKITEISTFKVSIKPESLGSMRVHLVVVDNNLTARIDVESVAARNVVESNLNTLRDTLAQQGIRVESFSVNIADSGNRNNGSRHGAPVKKGRYVREVESSEDSPVMGISTSLSSNGNNLTGSLSLVA